MATPCPRCGATKTESVRHGFLYRTLWDRGYHLRRCSFCNRLRIFKRHDRTQPHPDDLTAEQLNEYFNRKIAQSRGEAYGPPGAQGNDVAPVFSPQVEGGEARQSASLSAAAVATIEGEDYQLCPQCGGTVYRRSRRRWYEKLVNRPRMARCLKCDHRFPYPH